MSHTTLEARSFRSAPHRKNETIAEKRVRLSRRYHEQEELAEARMNEAYATHKRLSDLRKELGHLPQNEGAPEYWHRQQLEATLKALTRQLPRLSSGALHASQKATELILRLTGGKM
jgi:hypothetical protein